MTDIDHPIPPDVEDRDPLRVAIRRALVDMAEAMPEPLNTRLMLRLVRLGYDEPDRISMNQIRKLCASIAAHNAKAG